MVRKFKLSRLLLCILIIVSMAFSFAGSCVAFPIAIPVAAVVLVTATFLTVACLSVGDEAALYRVAESVYNGLSASTKLVIDALASQHESSSAQGTYITVTGSLMNQFKNEASNILGVGSFVQGEMSEDAKQIFRGNFAPLPQTGYLIQGYPVVSNENLGNSKISYYKNYKINGDIKLETDDFIFEITNSQCWLNSNYVCPNIDIYRKGDAVHRYEALALAWKGKSHSHNYGYYPYDDNTIEPYLKIVTYWNNVLNKEMTELFVEFIEINRNGEIFNSFKKNQGSGFALGLPSDFAPNWQTLQNDIPVSVTEDFFREEDYDLKIAVPPTLADLIGKTSGDISSKIIEIPRSLDSCITLSAEIAADIEREYEDEDLHELWESLHGRAAVWGEILEQIKNGWDDLEWQDKLQIKTSTDNLQKLLEKDLTDWLTWEVLDDIESEIIGLQILTGVLTSDIIDEAIGDIDDHGKTHILQEKHNWDKLVPDPGDPNNWDKIMAIIYLALAKGTAESYGQAMKKILELSGQIVVVTYKYVDGILRISDAWVK